VRKVTVSAFERETIMIPIATAFLVMHFQRRRLEARKSVLDARGTTQAEPNPTT